MLQEIVKQFEHPRREKEKEKENEKTIQKRNKKNRKKKKRKMEKRKNIKKEKKKNKKRRAQTTNHLRMYTLAQRILGSCPRMSGFLGGEERSLDGDSLLGIRGATCETARDLILRKRDNCLQICGEEKRGEERVESFWYCGGTVWSL